MQTLSQFGVGSEILHLKIGRLTCGRRVRGDTKSVTVIQNLDFLYPSHKENNKKNTIKILTSIECYQLTRNWLKKKEIG